MVRKRHRQRIVNRRYNKMIEIYFYDLKEEAQKEADKKQEEIQKEGK